MLHFERIACVRGQRLLFEDLSLALGPGEALHLTGPNGSGKSSLIRLAAGLLTAAAGKIERNAAAALADDHLALDRELGLAAALRFWTGKGAQLDRALDAMGIAGLAAIPVRLLSAGQARKARLARVLASDAPIWLLDEPLNGLDRDGAERLAVAVGAHRQGGGAVIAASHQALGPGWEKLELGR